ncbi:hypothetical protein IC575_005560 [Cucumis melo]
MHPHALARVTEGSSFQRSCDSCTNYFPAKFRVLVDWQVGFLLSFGDKEKKKKKTMLANSSRQQRKYSRPKFKIRLSTKKML